MNPFKSKRTFLVNKKFQYSILGWIALIGVLIDFIFYSANVYFFTYMEYQALQSGMSQNDRFFQFLDGQQSLMFKVFLTSTAITIVVIFWGGLYLSNKVAGPLYRFMQHLNQNRVTDAKPIQFRKNDYFLELQDAFNEFVKRK